MLGISYFYNKRISLVSLLISDRFYLLQIKLFVGIEVFTGSYSSSNSSCFFGKKPSFGKKILSFDTTDFQFFVCFVSPQTPGHSLKISILYFHFKMCLNLKLSYRDIYLSVGSSWWSAGQI